jgi:hypothetical protein
MIIIGPFRQMPESIGALIPQTLKLHAQVALASLVDITSRYSARGHVRVDQCVSAIRAVDVPVLVCLRSSCSHVTEVGEP